MTIFNSVYKSFTQVQPRQPGVNTLAYMPIDSSDTSAIVYDHSSAGKNFSWYGTADYDTLTSGKRVINLTGSNGIYIDSALVTSQPVTINLWLYRDGNQSNDSSVFVNQQDRGGMVSAWFNNSELASFYDQGGSLVGFNNKYSTSDQTWYNVAITFDSNTLTMYINGTQYTQNSGNNCGFSSVLATSFGFARNISGTQNFRHMTGKMGDLIVENVARTAQEVLDYYNQTKGNYEQQPRTPGVNTIAYFPFIDDVLDHSGNGVVLSGSGTKSTIGYTFNTSVGFTNNSIKFISTWLYVNSIGSGGGNTYDVLPAACMGYAGWNIYHVTPTLNDQIVVFVDSSYSVGGTIQGPSKQAWHHLCVGYDGTKTIVAIDGNVQTLYNGAPYNFGDSFFINHSRTTGDGTTFSETIIESECWTAQEISDYYDQTKANYGIS